MNVCNSLIRLSQFPLPTNDILYISFGNACVDTSIRSVVVVVCGTSSPIEFLGTW